MRALPFNSGSFHRMVMLRGSLVKHIGSSGGAGGGVVVEVLVVL